MTLDEFYKSQKPLPEDFARILNENMWSLITESARPNEEILEDKTMKPLPCPFCGQADIGFHEGTTYRWMRMQCEECGACGPDIRIQTVGPGTPEEWAVKALIDATTAWNERKQRKQFSYDRYRTEIERYLAEIDPLIQIKVNITNAFVKPIIVNADGRLLGPDGYDWLPTWAKWQMEESDRLIEEIRCQYTCGNVARLWTSKKSLRWR